MAARLTAYPDAVALEALRTWGDQEPWFPSWSEIRSRCEVRMAKLLAVRRELEGRRAWAELAATTDGSETGIEAAANMSREALRRAGKWSESRWLDERLEAFRAECWRKREAARDAARRQQREREDAERLAAVRQRDADAAARGEPVFD
jgi:hypothetical protein